MLIATLLAVAAVFLMVAWRLSRTGTLKRTWRPRELARAKLVYLEQLFRTSTPASFVAKVDQVYRRPNGRLILVELKTRSRHRTYLSDIIELSVQKVALEGATGEVVEPYAFVHVVAPDHSASSPYHRVALLEASQVVALERRREAILAGRLSANYAKSLRACRDCVFRAGCDRPR
jgi:hypothetical protein